MRKPNKSCTPAAGPFEEQSGNTGLGLASPVVGLFTKTSIQRGMEAGAKALKARAEARKGT